jgi:hypothetical protein
MFVNYKHELMERESIWDLNAKPKNSYERAQYNREIDRDAINKRVNYYEFTEKHDGSEIFPYKSIELGYYIHN